MRAYEKAQDEALGKAKDKYEDSKEEVKGLEDQIKSTSDRIQELRAQGPLTFVEQEELKKLETTNELLRLQYENLKRIHEENKKDFQKMSICFQNSN